MFRDLILGQYIPRDSFVHKADPRTKIISIFLLFFVLFMLKNPWGYVLLTGFVFFIAKAAKIPGVLLWKSLKPIFWFILFTLVFNAFFTPGEKIFSLGPLQMTKEGLIRGCLFSWRLLLLIVFSSLLTFCTSPLSLTNGLETLFAPCKKIRLPVHEIAMMITIALRFIPTLLEETEKIMKAQMARGMDFTTGSLLQRVKHLLPLLVPLFISAFRRADDLAIAMEARCYRGGEGRTSMKKLVMLPSDYLILLTVMLLLGIAWASNGLGKWSM